MVLFVLTILLTSFLAYKCRDLEISYDYVQIVPQDDPDFLYYKNEFKKTFGEDGNIFVVGFQDQKENSVFKKSHFDKFYQYCSELKKVKGIQDVFSLPTIRILEKDTVLKKFVQVPLFKNSPATQGELDTLLAKSRDLELYSGLFYNENTNALMVAVSFDGKVLNSANRQETMNEVLQLSEKFSNETEIKLHYAGLPYIRSIMVKLMKSEFYLLLVLSVLVTSLILFLFFKSWFSVFFTLLVIFVTVICTGGTIVLLDYKVTLLTGILPALIIIISIPNCIYMYNKYHQEYKRHGNKIKAVSRIIEKVGFLTFMTNINTAVGFFVLYFTDIVTIKQFGVSAGVLSVATFLITLIIIPTLLLFLPPPSDKQLRHLDMSLLKRINSLLENVAVKHRRWVYIATTFMVIISVYGISKLKTVSYMVDDLPENSSVKSDLAFFEQHFKGVMPLEIVVDLKKKAGIMKLSQLRKLEEFETYLLSLNNISPPLSILNVVKGATQAFYGGHPEFYTLPSNNDRPFILQYFGKETSKSNLVRALVDSTGRYVRFTCKVADIGTIRTKHLVENNIRPKAKEIFGEEKEVRITGTTLLFLRGNEYLIDDLTESLLYALVLIALMMVMIFSNPKMILISLIPNIIPMVITAGIMGLFNIPLKPSTALIFGISFGISIDSTIHYLSKYKQELAHHGGNVLVAVTRSIQEAGVSMIYTSVVLFSGFIIFIFSSFGGTVALGMLTSLTLFFAMFTNLTLLPALLLTFRKGAASEEQISKRQKRGKNNA
ncbi:MAG: efflux RND transporter permease subunit [Cytophagaceae bacterium]|jgi:hypothetical protein|nr:efflux RND transporter permease subunit [Cytophagaceae bacterium]